MAAKLKIALIGGVLAGALGNHQITITPVDVSISQETADLLKKDMQAFVDTKAINGGEQISIKEGFSVPLRLNLVVTHLDLNVNLDAKFVLEVDDDPNYIPPAATPSDVILTGGPASASEPTVDKPAQPNASPVQTSAEAISAATEQGQD